MELVWNRQPRDDVAAPPLQMFKMSRAPGILIYCVTALHTAREVQMQGL